MEQLSHICTEGEGIRALRPLPAPAPPPWLRARVMAAIAAVERRRRVRRVLRRCVFALALLLQFAAYAASERMGQ